MAPNTDGNRELSGVVIPHLRSQFARARPILFTGAGFSGGAFAVNGERVASVADLRRHLWELAFPDDPFDEGESLQAIYESALRKVPKQLNSELEKSLTVDAESLPAWYESYFAFPWFRAYTLNVDDLEVAAGRRFALPRRVVPISATAVVPDHPAHGALNRDLEVVHLNGLLADAPERVTFSVTQYAERLAGDEPWYARFAADLASRPFVFVGTQLDESPLWQHLELRDIRGSRDMKELRPRSYLITPSLGKARQELLARHNIIWLPATGEEFALQVLAHLEDARISGLAEVVASPAIGMRYEDRRIDLVDELAVHPDRRSEFLLGQEPIWADIQSGRAAVREIDATLLGSVRARLGAAATSLLVITGTAGTGKSPAYVGSPSPSPARECGSGGSIEIRNRPRARSSAPCAPSERRPSQLTTRTRLGLNSRRSFTTPPTSPP
jgi:hypothetical protein